ncbi:SAM-dependent methyltransferase, partial [Vibrio sp. 1636]|nr:SAM-dependent methyltransferase [Vibrio sp. 1636]
YFGEDWRFVSEAEHEYRMRFNERYAMQFLSHVVAYVRTT